MSDDWDPDPEWDDPGAEGSPRVPSLSEVDPASAVVGTLVGIAGLLLVLQPSVRAVSLFGTQVPTFVLSAGVLSLGFAVGAPVYLRRGYRLRGLAHAVGAVGFGALFFAAGFRSLLLLWLGLFVVIGGVLFLAAETRRL
ncbi:hypothetical protein [Halorarius halobius]|uniref:hypothetical protein n=1 Tax=Halorarius halobius TaxID=2962671 RepID=UPI0020CF0470|nr:hypothetical protein [Halorarius halobius]